MRKNIVIGVLILLCIVEGGYIILHHTKQRIMNRLTVMQPHMTGMPKRPPFLTPGMKFSDNPLSAKAYKVFPGDLSDGAKQAITGWDIKQTQLPDSSTQVNLVPHEAEDVQQEYIVRPGYSLYFIEMNLSDDTTGKDENRGDDMGVLVDQNGIVQ